jgi:hypothetical protein
MVQALEGPLTDLFSGGFGDDFLVSVKDYKFYAGMKLGECTEGIDSDLLLWVERRIERNAGSYDVERVGGEKMS